MQLNARRHLSILLSLALSAAFSAAHARSTGFEGWVQTELASGKKTIVLPKGTHHAYANNVPQRVLHISNNDDGLKNILFDLSGREDFVIDGNGAELILHGHIIPFYLREAKNITIKNLTIDYANPFFAQGTIVDFTDSYVDVQMKPEYPIGIDRGRLAFLNPDLPEPMHFNNINIFDTNGRIAYRSFDEYDVGREHLAEILEPGLVRIHSAKFSSLLERGQSAVFQYNTRSAPGFVVHRGENITLRDLTLHHTAAFGAIFEGTRNIYVENWKVVPRPGSGRLYTTHHDVVHFVECRGDIHIKNNHFTLQGDDDCNIHGIYRNVSWKMGERALVTRLSHYQQMGVDTLHVGDTIGFHDANTLELLGTGKLTKYQDMDVGQEDILHFDAPLPDLDWSNIVVTPRLHDVDVVISGNRFENHRARNLLIKTLGKVRIHDNYFNAQGAAIKIRAEASSWYEAGAVEDVAIYNNIFDQCNTGGFSGATFEIHATLKGDTEGVPLHRNVRIFDNTIYQIYKPLMILSHVENIEFYDNTILPGPDYEPWFKRDREPNNVQLGPAVIKGRFQKLN